MSQLVKPEKFFADRFGVTDRSLEPVFAELVGGQVDHADLYFEYSVSEELALEEGQVKRASRHVSQGAGVRAQAGERTGYAHTDQITLDRLALAASRAKYIADRGGSSAVVRVDSDGRPHDLYGLSKTPVDAPRDRKVALLYDVDRLAREYDQRITQVMATLWAEEQIILVVTPQGWQVGDVRPLTRLSVSVIAEEGENRQFGNFGGGGRVEFDFFLEKERWAFYTREAARQAILKLSAIDAPAGTMTVVLGPGWPGILLHEAIGHGLEGDFNRKKVSAFTGRIGQRVASELVTVVDDGTIKNRRGSLNIDDEGVPTSRTTLIESGILRGYLQDRLNARLMGMPLTGNGRRESFAHPPMPRMTNTFMLAGRDDPEEIIRSVDHGLYAVTFAGGQVDITNGKFVFSASEAYMIEGGRITTPVKGATLIGSGPDILTRVTRVGHDLKLDEGVGTCGKDGQTVPVGVGLPTIRVDGITVGGTQA